MNLKAIYEKSNGQYSNLRLNLYNGCSHGCLYCYNKREDRFHGPFDQPSKKASLANIQHDLLMLQGACDRRPVLMSVVGDPYDMGRRDSDKPSGLMRYVGSNNHSDSYTRSVLTLLRSYDHPFLVLTKGGMLAAKDFDLYSSNDAFGVTLTFDNDADSLYWEPGAALPADRIASLKEAHRRNIHTWVSMEPVIYSQQTVHLIEMSYEFVHYFWIGKLNHDAELERTIDWPKFRREVEALLQKCGKQPGTGYGLKHQLAEAI
jgi:DNA repair photolyase